MIKRLCFLNFLTLSSLLLYSSNTIVAHNIKDDTLQQNSQATEKESFYQIISKFAIEPEEPKEKQKEQGKPTSFVAAINKQFENQTSVYLTELSKREKKVVVYDLFSQKGCLKHTTDVIKPYVLQELSIVSDPLYKQDLLHALDQTQTTFGNVMLARLLSEPKVNRELIEKRCEFLKLLIEDESLFKRIEKALSLIKEKESLFLNLWTPYSNLDAAAEVNVNFITKGPKALQCARVLMMSALIQGMAMSWLTSYSAAFALSPLRSHTLSEAVLKTGALVGLGALLSYLTKIQISVLKGFNSTTYSVYTKMQSASVMFEAAREIAQALANKKQNRGYSLYGRLKRAVYHPERYSSEFKRLQELLEPDFYKKEAKWYSNFGKALSAYWVMKENKNHFIEMLEALGQLDAYMSVARMIKEHDKTDHKYSFVEFVDNQTTEINLIQSWNPLIGSKSLFEDLQFGEFYETPNAVLTGPHGGGKSTFMKTVAYSVILGQTFGIAPAAQARMTFTHKLFSYANIKEDLSQGKSTFMAEKARVNEIDKDIASLKVNELSITLMDEVFKGTMEVEGSLRLYKFIKKIASIDNSLLIVATHFEKPAILEDEMPERVTNYHVGLEEKLDGSFERTFKLIKGKNRWWFEDTDKRERYIDWLESQD